jgi:hypothetical protein
MSAPKRAAKDLDAKPAGKPARRPKAAPAETPASVVEIPQQRDVSAAAKALAAEIERAVQEGHADVLAPEALQALTAAVCRCYAAQVEAGYDVLPLAGRSHVTSTDVMATASGLLKAANLAVFELGMWQSWTGR